MVDNPNAGYYQPGKGTITGFDRVDLPQGNPNLPVTGWSLQQLHDFLLNVSDVNFPSGEWILRIEQMIRDHESDFNNPHKTTLDQIVGDFIKQMMGAIAPGTVPDVPPFYAFDATAALPMGTFIPATYSTTNLYRQTAGGWLVDPTLEGSGVYTDLLTNRPGIPLFSGLTNIVPSNWDAVSGVGLNTIVSSYTDTSLNYPFPLKVVKETPVMGMFGINIPMTQDLQTYYTCSFFIIPVNTGDKVRIYQPSDASNFVDIDLTDGSVKISASNMSVATTRYSTGVIRVSLSFVSLNPTADNNLRIVHINAGASGDGTRQGSLDRSIFVIGQPQATKAALGQPVIKTLNQAASTSTFIADLSRVGAPSTLSRFIVTIDMTMFPLLSAAPVSDPTIMSFGPLLITRDQKNIRVSVSGNPVFSSSIREGKNIITLSYSPTKLIFKDIGNDRQQVLGTYPSLSTSSVSFGPFGGYLHALAFYPKDDTSQTVEYLTDG